MSDDQTISVNFARPVPVFPLPGVTLLPQQLLPLHIFEERYRQMTDRALDASGQIAMAVLHPPGSTAAGPRVRPAVCLGQIMQHEKLPDGRYNLLLQGVCRARIRQEDPPADDRLFRQALLEPLGAEATDNSELADIRSWIENALGTEPLTQLVSGEHVLEYVRNDDVPTEALLELISFSLVDPGARYPLLAEGNARRRGEIIRRQLLGTARLLRVAESQRSGDWPKGLSWN